MSAGCDFAESSHIMEIMTILKVALAAIVMAAMPGRAATMSASATAPAVDNEDIANCGDVTGTDKWWAENSAAGAVKGRTFTTGNSSLRLNMVLNTQ